MLSVPKSKELASKSYNVTIEGQSKSEEVFVDNPVESKASVQTCVIRSVSIGDELAITISGESLSPTVCGMRLLRVLP